MTDPKNNSHTVESSTITSFDQEDIQKNKTMAGLAYIIFFLPLLACPDSKFGRYHANQGLLLLILGLAGSFVLGMIPIIGWLILPLFSIFVLVLGIIGLINGFNGKVKELPIIGKFRLLK
ncbi:Uncharacterized membrane protein [Natronincola peptidivorans]|uniref:Uncharacterized membrane protein n=1 Tax=Natronincola peptidivorans TaxID=426128 RepID=A0A1I0BWP1_9FIRM|nr:hypothetical protein [Natronincola peptidivorans]SET11263.1 Uncharacterized membrane protein [Natronincola peptidivorans]